MDRRYYLAFSRSDLSTICSQSFRPDSRGKRICRSLIEPKRNSCWRGQWPGRSRRGWRLSTKSLWGSSWYSPTYPTASAGPTAAAIHSGADGWLGREDAQPGQGRCSTAAWLSIGGEKALAGSYGNMRKPSATKTAGDTYTPDPLSTVATRPPFLRRWAQNSGSTTPHTTWICEPSVKSQMIPLQKGKTTTDYTNYTDFSL